MNHRAHRELRENTEGGKGVVAAVGREMQEKRF
jgi:hypothetical protein